MAGIWSVIGNIASVCSIVAIPFTLVQIISVKLSVKRSENAIQNILDLEKKKKAEEIQSILHDMQKKLSTLIIDFGKKGKSESSINKSCRSIIDSVNDCLYLLSEEFNESEKAISNIIPLLKRFSESHDKDVLRNTDDMIRTAISVIKSENKTIIDKEIKQMAK